MHSVFERREETLKIMFSQTALRNFLSASVSDHSLHLINADVAIFVSISLLTQVLLKISLRLELFLQDSVHLDKVALDLVELVGRNVLRIEDSHSVVKNVTLYNGTEVRTPTATDTVSRSRNDTLVCLFVIVEASQVVRHLSVPNLARRLVLEHK